MQILEKNKREIEERAGKMSDFLRMEYLEECSKKFHDIEIQRYCYSELSKLYEKRNMFSEAIKYTAKFKELCILQREKVNCFNKEIELYIKNGMYERAEAVYREGIQELKDIDRMELKRKIIEIYKQEAEKFEKTNRMSGALKIYEKLVNHVVDKERDEIKRKMAFAYKKLGRVRESIEIERELEKNI
jgi:tetratricopeptide (TPR) repeat protein